MPRLGGLKALERIGTMDLDVRVVVLTMHRDEAYAASALEAGAQGYVLKHADPSELVAALQAALAGNVFVSPSVASGLDKLQVGRTCIAQITPRQRAIMALVARGRSIKQIAAELEISPRTVEYHKYRLMRQLEHEDDPSL